MAETPRWPNASLLSSIAPRIDRVASHLESRVANARRVNLRDTQCSAVSAHCALNAVDALALCDPWACTAAASAPH
jgi:hypothetical protein